MTRGAGFDSALASGSTFGETATEVVSGSTFGEAATDLDSGFIAGDGVTEEVVSGSTFEVEAATAISVAAGALVTVGSVATGSAAFASSPCCGSNRLEVPIEIANPIMAAEVRARRLTSGEIGFNKPDSPPESFPADRFAFASLSAAQEGTDLILCVNGRFKHDLLLMTSA